MQKWRKKISRMSETIAPSGAQGYFPKGARMRLKQVKVKYRNYNHPQTCILEKDNHHQDNVFTNSHNPQDLKTNKPNNPEENIVRAVKDPLIFFSGTALNKILISQQPKTLET